ncbi:MAG: radical SAM protein [Lachnospiraceae bacterium]|nr:radical SAM protein [Lachnospiraceae bacterium]
MVTPVAEIRNAVDGMAEDGVTEITVSGGEPTMHPDFLEIVQYIQSKGMKLTVLTNSERFADERFSDAFLEIADRSSIKIITTIHSEKAAEHEAANQTAGSFHRTLRGLLKLSESGIRVIVKHCITKVNYRDLVSFYDFCEDTFMQDVDIQLCSIDYCGIPEEKLPEEMLSFPELRPYLEAMFDRNIEKKKAGGKRKLYCINIPLCSCDAFYWKEYLQDCRRKMYDEYKDPHKKDMSEVSNNVGADGEACKTCKVYSICSGTYHSAFQYFGDKIVKPFSWGKTESQISDRLQGQIESPIPSHQPGLENIPCVPAGEASHSDRQALSRSELDGMVSEKQVSDTSLSDRTDSPYITECPRQVYPEFFMIDLTNRCNMRCRYCLRNVSGEDRSISKKTLEDICDYIVRYCEKHHLKDVSVQPWGGEPLLELDAILFMKEKIAPAGTKVHFSIETNGLLLNEKTINLLYENRIGIGISIDGTKVLHDAQRITESGAGTHTIVEKNLQQARQLYGERLGTITTVTSKNVDGIEDILEYFAVQLHLTNVKFNFVHESMFSNCDGLCLGKENIAEVAVRILQKIVELNERGYRISEYNMKTKLVNILHQKYTDICHSQGCCGGRKMITFDMEGRIYPCELTDTPEENIGCIYDGTDLIALVSDAVQERDFFIPKRADVCVDCEWYLFCRGGCTVRAISVGKRPPTIDEIECAVNRSLYPALIELVQTKPDIVNRILDGKERK